MIGTALFDATGTYRYRLTRTWDASLPVVLFGMLNPSDANADDPDPTVTRCVGFGKAWGYGGLVVVNLFAFVSPHPLDLLTVDDPVGPENDAHIAAAVRDTAAVVLAHGTHSNRRLRERIRSRAWTVRQIVAKEGRIAQCLGTTKDRMPRHPLYLSGALRPAPLWCAA